MRKSAGLALVFSVLAATATAATKDIEKPDPEMLKMMEFLREMEMIKRIDVLQDMHRVESTGEAPAAPRKPVSGKQKETVK